MKIRDRIRSAAKRAAVTAAGAVTGGVAAFSLSPHLNSPRREDFDSEEEYEEVLAKRLAHLQFLQTQILKTVAHFSPGTSFTFTGYDEPEEEMDPPVH